MNQQTSRTMMWLSIILLIVGSAIGSPAGTVFVLVLAALSAVGPVISGPRVPRIMGTIVLVLSLLMAAATLPAAKAHMNKYKNQSSGKIMDSSPGQLK